MDRRSDSRASSWARPALPATLRRSTRCWPGIEAAPAGQDPDAWLELIGPDLPTALTAALRERRARLRRPDRGMPDHADRLAAAARRPARARRRRLRPDAHRRAWQRVSARLCRAGGLAHRLHRLGGPGRRDRWTRATVLSDGRYTVQLAQEVDAALFERRHLVDAALERAGWRSTCRQGARLGYDPWLARRAERDRLESRRQGQGRQPGRPSTRTRSTRSGPIARRRRSRRCAGTTSAMPARQTPPSASGSRPRSARRVPTRSC